MRDIPMLFSAPMISALLAGRKVQTRRPIKLPTKGEYIRPDMGGWAATTSGGGGCFRIGRTGERIPVPEEPAIWNQTTGTTLAMRYAVGDRIWVRETVRAEELSDGTDGVRYLADEGWIGDFAPIPNTPEAAERWGVLHAYRGSRGEKVPGIHMPKWASRLTLYVTEVRVERLQDCSEADARDEGVEYETADPPFWYVPGIYPHSITAVGAEERNPRPAAASYAKLWNHINGPGSWESNPWVVAISFRVHRGNIDAAPLALAA